MEEGKTYNEDCLITMSKMPDNYIDFVITSPPYDNIRNYNGYSFEFEKIVGKDIKNTIVYSKLPIATQNVINKFLIQLVI